MKINHSPFFVAISFSIVFFATGVLQAEPWMANRYSKNCAACHAPGRFNVKAPQRRCTLSCQGCHVSPQGGGINNAYGKWTKNRWLKSFDAKSWHGKEAPAPLKDQLYHENVQAYQIGLAQGTVRDRVTTVKKAEAEKQRETQTLGSKEAFAAEKSKDYEDHELQTLTAKGPKAFKATIPLDDPLYTEMNHRVTAGGGFRYFLMSLTDEEGTSRNEAWPMAFFGGLRWKMLPKFSFVAEGLFLKGPGNSAFSELFTSEARAQAAYFIADQLPYNSYVMGGLYRPMFGYDDANHFNLRNRLLWSGNGQRRLFKGVGVGAAPNVPSFNFHYLDPFGNDDLASQHKGFVGNLGLNFVRYGLSGLLSYWQTSRPGANNVTIDERFLSVSGGASFWKVTLNSEFIYLDRSDSTGDKDSGFLISAYPRFRVWREMYLTGSYHYANLAPSLEEGASGEFTAGIRLFTVSGIELESYYFSRVTKATGRPDTKDTGLMTQIHAFF